MKYLTEYRDGEKARALANEISRLVTRPWAIMEVCGGQTHSIIRNGIDQILPDEIEMIHGPGCPVCVTPLEVIDKALEIASRPASEVMVIGHTDTVGGLEANDKLSLRRAEAVRDILVAAGVPGEKIELAGRGERETLVKTGDEVAEPRNRRVEISVR